MKIPAGGAPLGREPGLGALLRQGSSVPPLAGQEDLGLGPPLLLQGHQEEVGTGLGVPKGCPCHTGEGRSLVGVLDLKLVMTVWSLRPLAPWPPVDGP